MVDEVQTGLGRTGQWFGFQHFGVQPDVVTMAKALGNGVPIGACAAKRDVAAAFEPGDHATTYGGQPLATSAARAVLAEMRRLDIPAVAGRGRRQAAPGAARPRRRRARCVASACCWPPSSTASTPSPVAAALLERGLVVNAVTPTALRLAPPLTVSDDEIDEAVALIGAVLAEAAAGSGGGAA